MPELAEGDLVKSHYNEETNIKNGLNGLGIIRLVCNKTVTILWFDIKIEEEYYKEHLFRCGIEKIS